jgi:ribosomal protein L7Ae-like RNA K-turn-binding protein
MVNEKKVMQMLSISSKAGKVASGEFQCEEVIRKGSACVVLVSADASDNTCKKFSNKCEFYGVPFYKLSCDKEVLGRTIGKEKRSCVAVTDEGLAGALLKNLKENE